MLCRGNRSLAEPGRPMNSSKKVPAEALGDAQVWKRRAFEKQLVNILPDLRAFACFLCNDRFEADDLVQDTVVRALRAFEQFDLNSNMRAWTFRILRNLRINGFRKVRLIPLDDELDTRAINPSQHDSIELKEVITALSELSREHREVIALVRGQGLEYEEAAAVMGCALGTIKSRLNRADAALRKAVGDEVKWKRRPYAKGATLSPRIRPAGRFNGAP